MRRKPAFYSINRLISTAFLCFYIVTAIIKIETAAAHDLLISLSLYFIITNVLNLTENNFLSQSERYICGADIFLFICIIINTFSKITKVQNELLTACILITAAAGTVFLISAIIIILKSRGKLNSD